MDLTRRTVYREAGRFAGWPANYGLWRFGDEVVAMFAAGWIGPDTGLHPRDKGRPFHPTIARSPDRGDSWAIEPFTGTIPAGSQTLSGDEHVDRRLQVGPRLGDHDFLTLKQPIDFTDPETIVLCARTGLEAGSRSWFYLSGDRARSWHGPYPLPHLGTRGISTRTDIVPLGRHEALFQLTSAKSDGTEGRVLSAWTGDGGRSFQSRGWVGDEPEGMAIMPSSLMLPDGTIMCARRCASGGTDRRHWIDLYASNEQGHSWRPVATPVADTGAGGNPPAMIRLSDGRLIIVYGSRARPYGLRAVSSDDCGTTWTAPQVLTDDVADRDLGYPRAAVLDDDSVLAVSYANRGNRSERHIEALRWKP